MHDDAAASASPSPSQSCSPSTLRVTVAAAPPGHLVSASAIRKPSPSSHVGGDNREDAWSDSGTSTLINAPGGSASSRSAAATFATRSDRRSARSSPKSYRDSYSKLPKSDVECKNHIDTLKKKYKVEKAKSDSS